MNERMNEKESKFESNNLPLFPQIVFNQGKYETHTHTINHESACLSVCRKTIWNINLKINFKK